MDATALSIAAREMRTQLAADLEMLETQILIGHPNASVQHADQGQGKHYLNIFFYRVEYDGYPADGTGENPFYIRVHCLITAFAKDENIGGGQKILAGENDLRLIGGVMDSLHNNPLFLINDSTDNTVAQIETIISNITLDDINKIWSTQGDTAYRPSVAYELTLLPIPVSVSVDTDLKVGSTAIETNASLGKEGLPGGGLGLISVPTPLKALSVDSKSFNWAPHICFWTSSGLQYDQTLSSLSPGAIVRIIGMGEPNEIVTLHWELWDSLDGWQPVTAPPSTTLELASWSIDPKKNTLSFSREVELPSVEKGQMSVYATRTISRPDTDPIILRSNPLLVTVST